MDPIFGTLIPSLKMNVFVLYSCIRVGMHFLFSFLLAAYSYFGRFWHGCGRGRYIQMFKLDDYIFGIYNVKFRKKKASIIQSMVAMRNHYRKTGSSSEKSTVA